MFSIYQITFYPWHDKQLYRKRESKTLTRKGIILILFSNMPFYGKVRPFSLRLFCFKPLEKS